MIGEFVASFLGMEVRPCSQLFDDCHSRVPVGAEACVSLGILLASSTAAVITAGSILADSPLMSQ